MSAINDFSKVWEQKFPGSELPAAWEEDVKNNLAKHRQRVAELQEELEKEQVYVKFLESLLEEVEKRKGDSASSGVPKPEAARNGNKFQQQSINDVINDTLERRSLAQQASLSDLKSTGNTASPLQVVEEEKNGSEPPARPDSNEKLNEDQDTNRSEDDEEVAENLKDHFVTVIEVNGIEKERQAASSQSGHNSKSEEDAKRLKKVPPRPPPKFFRQKTIPDTTPTSTSSSPTVSGESGSSPSEADEKTFGSAILPLAKSRPDRPVVFDSKRNSTGGIPSTNGSTVSGGTGNYANVLIDRSIDMNNLPSKSMSIQASKRFEGCKLPLPNSSSLDAEEKGINGGRRFKPKEQNNTVGKNSQEPKETNNVRSKILDIVNKMESTQKPQQSPKVPEYKRSSSFRQNPPTPAIYNETADPMMSDYVDPCDIELDAAGDQIYDSPPDEHDLPLETPEKPIEARKSRKPKMGDIDIENEPVYDTVAPDQDDDYVVLTEEGVPSEVKANSLKKLAKISDAMSNIEGAVAAHSSDGATIKSQTSIISGHSVGTTNSSGTTSDTECLTGSPSPADMADGTSKSANSNYVNIDYFLNKSKRKDSRASAESEEDESPNAGSVSFDDGDRTDGETSSNLELFDLDSGVYSTSVDSTTAGSRHTEALTMTAAEQEKYAMFRCMLTKVIDLEKSYIEFLNVMILYMKALKATLKTSKPVLSTDDFNIIFYKIPDLHNLHDKFLTGLQQKNASVGKNFENLAHEICIYGAFLQNYSRAVDTVRKCSQNNSDFAEMTRSIKLRSMNNKNQEVSLETLLYSPVSRVQKNIEIIEDLLKCLPESHPDYKSLKSAHKEFQSFLTEFKMIQPEQLFHGQDRNPRHLVKNSFIVELSEGNRKLRHLFLFNDVLVCAKYKASSKGEKFTFELKWYIPVVECTIVEESSEPRESTAVNLVALRSQASTVRDQIKRQTSRDDPKKAKAEKQRKKLAELEAQLVLASPNLVFKVKGNGRAYTFFLSSEFERSQWVDAIETLKSGHLSSPGQLSMQELQSWLTSCRKHLKTNMGSYLLRSGRDENLLVGDLHILIGQLTGILRPADLYICLEVDSYGHFFRKAKTKMVCESIQPNWNQDFVIELEGSQNLRILLYEDHPRNGTLIRAKTTIELNRNWLTSIMNERKIELQDYTLTITTKFVPSEMTIRRVPTAKPSGLYGAKIWQVCSREKRDVPFIITSCVREVERRGINEVGVYRVSGSASDVSRLKKAFETNCYEAEQLLKDVDIHSVTGALKLYMRELPEALFTDALYPKFFEAFNLPDVDKKRKELLHLFSTLPYPNQPIILFLLDHMTTINSHENHNKMSLHNLATVFGPTLLRPGARSDGGGNVDLLAAGTVDVMAQAGILYFFLSRKASGEPISS